MSESFAVTLRLLRLATIVRVHPADRARLWLGKASMSQSELARRAQIDAAYVQRLEKGVQTPPSRRVVERLAAAMALDDLLRARLLVSAGYWPWPGRADDELERAIATAAAVLAGDYRPALPL